MESCGLLLRDGTVWVSRSRLTAAGITDRGIDSWWERETTRYSMQRCYVGQALYVRYDTIPVRSRRLLPPAAQLRNEAQAGQAAQQHTAQNRDVAQVLELLLKAYQKEATTYFPAYAEQFGEGPKGKAWQKAQRRALWARLVQLRNDRAAVSALWKAHTALVERKQQYRVEATFRRALKQAQAAWEAGNPDAFVLHGNLNNTHAALTHQTLHEYLLRTVWSMGLPLSKTAAARLLAVACANLAEAQQEAGQPVSIKAPSESWVKSYLLRNEVRLDTDAHRYGEDYARRHLPYMSMRPALYANDQWQIDGWDVPFYCNAPNGDPYRLKVVVVMDAYSRRLLGYAFGERENGAVILAAFRKAVETAGVLPSLFVSDKHSFTTTQEAAYLKEQIERRGCTWTVTTNPQAKSILERFFGQFEQRYLLTLPGFVGAGPADRRPTARLKPERRKELLKTVHKHEPAAVMQLVTERLATYNHEPLPNRTESPRDLYEAGAYTGGRAVDQLEIMRLFWQTRRMKVTKSGITLRRGAASYRFSFTEAQHIEQWNNREVLVRYDDEYAQILLLCPETEKTITLLPRDERTNAVPAHQTAEDHSRRAQHGHLKRELKERSDARNQQLTKDVEAQYGALPYEAIQGVVGIRKEQSADARIQYEINDVAREHGYDPVTVTMPKQVELVPPVFRPNGETAPGRDERSPYAQKGSHKRLQAYDHDADPTT